MEQLKEKMKVVILCTLDTKAPMLIHTTSGYLQLFSSEKWYNANLSKAHLYVVSNKEIKEGLKKGDKILCDERNHISEKPDYVIRTFSHYENGWIMTDLEGQGENPDWTSKIEASTDKSLTIGEEMYSDVFDFQAKRGFKQTLPLISQGFVKKYTELQGKIEDVMVDMIEDKLGWNNIPKVDKNNYITITKVKDVHTETKNVFKLKHVVLYAKNWYKRTDNVFEDLKQILELDDYTPFTNGDVAIIIRHAIQRYILESSKNQEYKLIAFLDGLNPSESWKNGYYCKENHIWFNGDVSNLPNYNFNEAMVRSALSLLAFTSLEDLGWEKWPTVNPNVLSKTSS